LIRIGQDIDSLFKMIIVMSALNNSNPSRHIHRFCLFVLLILTGISSHAEGQDRVLLELDHPDARSLLAGSIFLDTNQDVEISAVAPVTKRNGDLLGNAWILNATTRELVWTLEDVYFEGEESSGNEIEVEQLLALSAGTYEVYFASFPMEREDYQRRNIASIGGAIRSLVSGLFDHGDWRHWRDLEDRYDDYDARNFGITIRGSGRGEKSEYHQSGPGVFGDLTIVGLTETRNDRYAHQGFELAQPMDIKIYAIGEIREDESFDHGWIVNTQTRERVWTMGFTNTEPAGGAQKNRMFSAEIHLPAGTYAAYYATDDSHAPEAWNSAPPYDPVFWGLSIGVQVPDQMSAIDLFDVQTSTSNQALISLTKAREEEILSEGFTLTRPMRVRIMAVGEGSGGRMYDYGWILDMDSRRRIWEMDYYDTEHAGGGAKNRIVDTVLELEAGSYRAYYMTDDSHHYMDWNTAPPYEREAWGLTILPVDGQINLDAFQPYQLAENQNVLVRLDHLRDHESVSKRFTLDREQTVEIYAIGEGSGGHMYDYGWIKNDDTGEVVWEMTYRMTDHAGGNRKNREVRRSLTLEAGTYRVYFETDGSHAYGDWNARPPMDPESWGITVWQK
jgi:hypothetical protein